MFNCKGPIVPHDTLFSPNGFFRQNQVTSVIGILKSLDTTALSSIDNTMRISRTHQFFGYDFHPTEEEDLIALISMCRKRTAMIEVMSRTSAFSYGGVQSTMRPLEENDRDEAFIFRLEISRFLNFLVQNRTSYVQLDTRKIFNGLILSLGSVKEWPTSLQYHPGSPTGNQVNLY